MIKLTTLCFCLRGNKILLAMKKRGFGAGKWNGYGGKVGEKETPRQAAIREIKEESGLSIFEEDLKQVALIRFYFDGVQLFECHVFLAKEWRGKSRESEEMKPRWFSLSHLPFEEMWVADRNWLPLILGGKKLDADVYFNHDGSKLEKFAYQEKKFDQAL